MAWLVDTKFPSFLKNVRMFAPKIKFVFTATLRVFLYHFAPNQSTVNGFFDFNPATLMLSTSAVAL